MGWGDIFRRIMRLFDGENAEKADVTIVDRHSEVASMAIDYREIHPGCWPSEE